MLQGGRIKRDFRNTDHLVMSTIDMTGTRGTLNDAMSMTTDGRSQIIKRRGAGWLAGAGAGTDATTEMRGGHGRQERGEIVTDTSMGGARRSFAHKRTTRGKGRLRTEPEPSPRQLFISATSPTMQLKVRILRLSPCPYHPLITGLDLAVELYSFIFEGFTGTDEGRSFSFRLNRDEATGRTRGSAFIDFLHLEASKAFVELCDGAGLFFPKQPNPNPGFPQPLLGPEEYVRLRVEFSKNLPRAHNEEDTGHKVPVLDDWLCPACNILNFARRHECFQCQAPRMPDAQVVRSERGPMKRPTACISIQGEALMHMEEERIKRLFSGQAAVTDVRLIRDKRSKAGVLAYVRYGSVSEAARALSLLQGVVPSGSSSGLVLSFSRDVFKDQPSGNERDQAKPVETHQSWEPKEFGDAGGWEPKAFDESKEEESKNAEPKAEPSSQAATSSGFILDPASGYYYDAKSGYYYDPKTSLYYHSSTKHWYSFNQASGEYKVITQTSTATVTATADPAPKATFDPFVGPEVKPAGPSEPSASQAKKASAVIGAAPQLNPDGLLLAAFQMDEKIEAAKAKPKTDPSLEPPAPVQPIQGVIHKGKWADKKKKQLMEAQANANKDP
jgi:hypothetical protein